MSLDVDSILQLALSLPALERASLVERFSRASIVQIRGSTTTGAGRPKVD